MKLKIETHEYAALATGNLVSDEVSRRADAWNDRIAVMPADQVKLLFGQTGRRAPAAGNTLEAMREALRQEHPDDLDNYAKAPTAHDGQAAPVIEEYRTAVLSTAHMMEADYQILTDNAAQVGRDDGLFWIHDTQGGAILRFEASYYAVGELAGLGASRLLIDTILRLEKLGYQAAHFDRDADLVTGWPVDPQYADENE